MKKRGFGQGRWNGFGGKVEKNESIRSSVIREVEEEAGIVVDPVERGALYFQFTTNLEPITVYLYSAHTYRGQPHESDEMKPQWFDIQDVPYDTMWPDDRFWLPEFLQNKNIEARFTFSDINTLLDKDVKIS